MTVNFDIPVCCHAVLLEMALQPEERVNVQEQQFCYSL